MQQNDTSGLPHKIKWITLCGLLMAINTIFSSFSIPVPGGHIYLNDIIIVIAALSLDPLGAFLVGGVGAFLGDFFWRDRPRRPHRHRGIHLGQGLRIQHLGICHAETPF